MQARLKQLGLTPVKGALIAGLVLLLAVIWGPQLFSWGGNSSGNSRAATARVSPAKSNARRPSTRSNVRSLGGEAAKKKRALPASSVSLSSSKRQVLALTASDAGAYDPFMVPNWSPAAAMIVQKSAPVENMVASLTEEEMEDRAALLREAGVAMILVSSTGRMAKIGDQTVQVGDEIDGFRVMDITAEGVVLQPSVNDPTNVEDRDDSPSSL